MLLALKFGCVFDLWKKGLFSTYLAYKDPNIVVYYLCSEARGFLIFYFLSVVFLCEFGLVKRIPARYRNSKTLILMMVLLGFFSMELHNVFCVLVQETIYFDPIYAWNFLVNRIANFVVVSVSVGIVALLNLPNGK